MDKISFWEYCQLRAPEFYTDVRNDLRMVAESLQNLYATKTAAQRKLLVLLPQRSGKTRTMQLFAEWVFKQDASKHIIVASYNLDIAHDFSRNVREGIDDSPSAFKCVGVGDSLTGCCADISILDDPVKDSHDANSERILDRQWKWFVETLSTRLSEHAIQIVCMSKWSDNDIAGRIIAGARVNEWMVLDFINGEPHDQT